MNAAPFAFPFPRQPRAKRIKKAEGADGCARPLSASETTEPARLKGPYFFQSSVYSILPSLYVHVIFE